ncbi:hypothetical protein LRS73_28330 [Methylobacterium currus]|uniref:hypothetical protein n=1 Tax=Methylobacterium currus TaxID=2051553 RepID=UPI001E44D91C|nr:hypothetical protein [Methylobacterium currus]UHC16313.1 hypothetical protein LRS73_28330 [Methylobacterium currus]
MTFASYQTMAIPEGGTSNIAPEGSLNVQVRTNNGPVSVSADGTTTTHGVQGLNTAEFGSPVRDGILSSARTKTGSPIMGDIKGDDLIRVQGYEMQVSTAEQLGMISRDASGRYVEVDGGVEAASREPEQATVEAPEVAFASPHAEQNLTELVSATTAGNQIAAMQELINGGEVSTQTLNRAASEAGREPSQMAESLELVKAAFKAQADASVAAQGVEDADALWAWARANRPNDLKQAMNNHGSMRDPRGYAGIAQEYVASVADRDPSSVLNAEFGGGISARMAGKEVVLSIPGRGEMSYRSALKAGFIKVSGL